MTEAHDVPTTSSTSYLRQLCSIDLSVLHPGLTASAVTLHLGSREKVRPRVDLVDAATPAVRRTAGVNLDVNHAELSVRRHCHVALVVVYVMTKEERALWGGFNGGEGGVGGVSNRVQQSAFCGLSYNKMAGPLAAPPAVRLALVAAAVEYEQAFPNSLSEICRELQLVALAVQSEVRH